MMLFIFFFFLLDREGGTVRGRAGGAEDKGWRKKRDRKSGCRMTGRHEEQHPSSSNSIGMGVEVVKLQSVFRGHRSVCAMALLRASR